MIGIILYCAIEAALLDPNGYNESYTTTIYAEGKVLTENENTYMIDFSEDIKRLPIVGTPFNYSNVEVKKDKCRL